jgi:hypothetical protein
MRTSFSTLFAIWQCFRCQCNFLNFRVQSINLFKIMVRNWELAYGCFIWEAYLKCGIHLIGTPMASPEVIPLTKWYKYCHCTRSASLNPGYAHPWGYASRSQGAPKKLYTYNLLFGGYTKWVQFFFEGTHKNQILICGDVEGYNFDLGVRGYQKVEIPWTI